MSQSHSHSRPSHPADAVWRDVAIGSLVLRHNVKISAAESEVNAAVSMASEAGERLEDLLGPPREWAEQIADMWHEDPGAAVGGAAPFEYDDPWTPRTGIVAIFGAAAVLSLLFFVVYLVRDGFTMSVAPGALLAPIALGVAICGANVVFTKLRPRYPFGVVAAVSAAAVIAASLAIALLFSVLQEPLLKTSVFIFACEAALCAGLAWAIARLWPDKHVESPHEASSVRRVGSEGTDEEWVSAFVASARNRGDLTERDIQDAVREARSHTRESGLALVNEFGGPDSYAMTLPATHALRKRREAILMTVVAIGVTILCMWQFLDPESTAFARLSTMLWALLCASTAAIRWKGARG